MSTTNAAPEAALTCARCGMADGKAVEYGGQHHYPSHVVHFDFWGCIGPLKAEVERLRAALTSAPESGERVVFRDLSDVEREGFVLTNIGEAAVVEFNDVCFVAHDGADEVWDGSALMIHRKFLRAAEPSRTGETPSGPSRGEE